MFISNFIDVCFQYSGPSNELHFVLKLIHVFILCTLFAGRNQHRGLPKGPWKESAFCPGFGEWCLPSFPVLCHPGEASVWEEESVICSWSMLQNISGLRSGVSSTSSSNVGHHGHCSLWGGSWCPRNGGSKGLQSILPF